MANSNDAVFQIDAGKILAKLHLAGQQAIPNSIPINTGIENPVAKADPKNLGNTEFNLDNKTGEYQFAVMKLLKYQVLIDLKKNKNLEKLQKDLEKAIEEDAKKTEKGGKDKHADAKLTDKTKDEDDKESDKEDGEDGEEQVDKNSKTYKVQQEILKEYASYKLKEYKEDKENFKESLKSFIDAVKAENELRKKTKQDNEDKLQKEAFTDIKTYFKTVSGDKNASKIKEADIVKLNADVDGKTKDPTQFKDIKDFKITTEAVDDQIKKYEEELQSSKPNDWITRNIMFAIGFSVEIETM